MKTWIAILFGKKFVLTYPDGRKTRKLHWDEVRPLQILFGGTLEIIWRNQ